jgi:5-methylcytosine-specific restriction enzyme subunit McrC
VNGATRVTLHEWETLSPTSGGKSLLGGRALQTREARELAERLASERVLSVVELRAGLSVTAFSHVGQIQLDDLSIVIKPKLGDRELLSLLRYAYGLRDLRLFDDTRFDSPGNLLQDILIAQLQAEGRELLDRGLARQYVLKSEHMETPVGRIDTNRLARSLAAGATTLPCQHHPRSSDHLLNQVLVSGLALAADLATDQTLRTSVLRLARQFDELVQPIVLGRATFAAARRRLTRLVSTYEPALQLIELLHYCSSVALGDTGTVSLRGFLFDMNRFFQALASRFLREHLDDCEVADEQALIGMVAYRPGHNPRGRQAPRPRPDFVVKRTGEVPRLLDAKYKDLWEHPLPREMLYQLSVYALSQPKGSTAAIVYPTSAVGAREAVLEIRDPVGGGAQGFVAVRPMILPRVVDALSRRDEEGAARLARELAFGTKQFPGP